MPRIKPRRYELAMRELAAEIRSKAPGDYHWTNAYANLMAKAEACYLADRERADRLAAANQSSGVDAQAAARMLLDALKGD